MNSDYLIRTAIPADAKAIIEIYRPFVEGTHTSFETIVPDEKEMISRILKYQEKHCWLVYEQEGTIGGYAYSSPHRSREAYQWTIETSVYVAPDFRRKGIAEKLYRCLLNIAKHQGYFTALAGIGLPNSASIAFHEKIGFQRVSIYENIGFKFGKWHTNHWFAKPLQGDYGVPGEIIPVSELRVNLLH